MPGGCLCRDERGSYELAFNRERSGGKEEKKENNANAHSSNIKYFSESVTAM